LGRSSRWSYWLYSSYLYYKQSEGAARAASGAAPAVCHGSQDRPCGFLPFEVVSGNLNNEISRRVKSIYLTLSTFMIVIRNQPDRINPPHSFLLFLNQDDARDYSANDDVYRNSVSPANITL
jgi:hypothetical protein